MEITPGIGPEDIDPRKVQRLLWVALGIVALGFVAYALTRRVAGEVEDAAEAAWEHAREARDYAELAQRSQQAVSVTLTPTTRTTEAPDAEGPEAEPRIAAAD